MRIIIDETEDIDEEEMNETNIYKVCKNELTPDFRSTSLHNSFRNI